MQKKKYVLKYEILLEGADPIKNKEINIKNCFNEFNAKTRLEGYLKKKYKNLWDGKSEENGKTVA